MSLKSLMQNLKNRAVVPSVPPETSGGGTREPAWIKVVPLVPSVPLHLNETGRNALIGQFGDALHDPFSAEPDVQKNLKKPVFPLAENYPAQKQTANPNAWRELAQAYYAHHFNCPVCIAAGRGTGYGLRCGTGAALWIPNDSTV